MAGLITKGNSQGERIERIKRITTDTPVRPTTHPRGTPGRDDGDLRPEQIRSDPPHPLDPFTAVAAR